jgi:lipopolysaccharide export system permease protein
MGRLEEYIIRHFSTNFFSIFLPLFIIASIVFLVRLASITAVVELSSIDMTRLYLFILPELLFYTLPASFVISGVSTLSKLSRESEMIVFFTFGISPNEILKIYFKIALYFTFTMLLITVVISPHTSQLQSNFLHYKKTESIFNINATEFGQKFGDWSLFIDSVEENSIKREKIYKDIVLFYKDEITNEEKFIISKEAKILNSQGIFQLKLKMGTVFLYRGEKVSQLNFTKMKINDIASFEHKNYLNTLEYIEFVHKRPKDRAMFINKISISLFPILSLFFILAFGVKYMRYGNDYTSIYITLLIISYFVITFSVSSFLVYLTPVILTLISLFLGFYLYKKLVLSRY